MTTRSSLILGLVIALVPLGCADRSTGLTLDETDSGSPYEPGAALGACYDEDDCDGFDWCVHPAGESGFCTYACGGAGGCPDAIGGTATQTCLLVEDVDVCALDCANGRSCPAGMRCEQILASDAMARSICF